MESGEYWKCSTIRGLWRRFERNRRERRFLGGCRVHLSREKSYPALKRGEKLVRPCRGWILSLLRSELVNRI